MTALTDGATIGFKAGCAPRPVALGVQPAVWTEWAHSPEGERTRAAGLLPSFTTAPQTPAAAARHTAHGVVLRPGSGGGASRNDLYRRQTVGYQRFDDQFAVVEQHFQRSGPRLVQCAQSHDLAGAG